MSLPAEFNETEFLQAVVRRYVNHQVRADFQDLGGENWEPDVTTSRGQMRHALTHKDADSMGVTCIRLILYYFVFNKAKSLQPDLFGMTKKAMDASRKYHPTVTLRFEKDRYDPTDPEDDGEGEISFKIMDETSKTFTKSKVKALAAKIKRLFANPTQFVWHKGKLLTKYTEIEKGYEFFVLAHSVQHAKALIEQTMDIQGHSPDWKYLTVSKNEQESAAYPTHPGTEIILGETENKPKLRPVVNVGVLCFFATI